jgi:hypothetical protein
MGGHAGPRSHGRVAPSTAPLTTMTATSATTAITLLFICAAI